MYKEKGPWEQQETSISFVFLPFPVKLYIMASFEKSIDLLRMHARHR